MHTDITVPCGTPTSDGLGQTAITVSSGTLTFGGEVIVDIIQDPYHRLKTYYADSCCEGVIMLTRTLFIIVYTFVSLPTCLVFLCSVSATHFYFATFLCHHTMTIKSTLHTPYPNLP